MATQSTVAKTGDKSARSPILRLCRRFVAGLSKVDCRRLVRPCRPCRGRHCRQSWTCSTRSTFVGGFVESGWFLSPECRWSFRLCCLCVQGLKPGTNWRQSWQSPKPATNRRQRRLSTLAPYKPHVVGWARGDPIGLEVIKFWCWSESRCWSGIAFPLSLTLQDRTFCSQLGRADLWPLANAVVHTL